MSLDMYHLGIKSLAEAARGAGPLDGADVVATVDNPLCGDRVRLALWMQNDRIARIAHEVRGCLLCRAAASVLGMHAPGRGRDGVAEAADALRAILDGDGGGPPGWVELEVFRPVAAYRSRHGCVLLPFRALLTALRERETEAVRTA